MSHREIKLIGASHILFVEFSNSGLDGTDIAFIRDYNYDFANNNVALNVFVVSIILKVLLPV